MRYYCDQVRFLLLTTVNIIIISFYVVIWELHYPCHNYDCCIVSQEEAYRLKEIIKQIMLNTKCYVNMCPIYDCVTGVQVVCVCGRDNEICS
jgi:hypothetical protein